MRLKFILYSVLAAFFLFGHNSNFEKLKMDSEVKIIHDGHPETSILIKNIKGKEVGLKQIEDHIVCNQGKVKTKKHYLTMENQSIENEVSGEISEYIRLWDDLMKIGLSELATIPFDDAVDPFEFVDSWNIDQDTYRFYFRVGDETISFVLYDIESYRDKRLTKILNRILFFLGEKEEKSIDKKGKE